MSASVKGQKCHDECTERASASNHSQQITSAINDSRREEKELFKKDSMIFSSLNAAQLSRELTLVGARCPGEMSKWRADTLLLGSAPSRFYYTAPAASPSSGNISSPQNIETHFNEESSEGLTKADTIHDSFIPV